ncbi:hypothetical protein FEE95_06880 [Maribacter algarum]|uniref:Uncharacterized protein n=1 Tax=Maribacter algarum (ex Zhang et al. 2020) TaxID=2578118 RepID=A0A5S3PW51_9FLAO|nr:hypothetical protein [Maribacter algarum]TMM59150.1 hypothetical protein FEE95_06880 [Maribacter algarum]
MIKSIVFLFLIMNNPIEGFLGLNISELPYPAIEMDSEEGIKTYVVSDQEMVFLFKEVSLIIIETDNKGIIKSISTDFKEIIDEDYYKDLVDKLGKPDQIKKMSAIINEDSEVLDSGNTAISTTGYLEECQFVDKPMFIKWNKLDKDIVFSIFHDQGNTHLTINSSE